MTTPIPSPPALPLLGHITQIDKEVPLRSFELLADQYGEIYQLNLITRQSIIISSYDLMNEVSNDKRFSKAVVGGLVETRKGLGDGLFTVCPRQPVETAHVQVLAGVMLPDVQDVLRRYAGG